MAKHNLTLLNKTEASLQSNWWFLIDCSDGLGERFYLEPVVFSDSEYTSTLLVAQLNAGEAISRTSEAFREVATSGKGLLLIILIAGIVWIAWKKRTQ